MGGLTVDQGKAMTVPGLVSDRRLYVSRDGTKLIEEGSVEAGFLLAAGKGDIIPQDQVDSLGLELVGGKVKQTGKPAKVAEPAADASMGERLAAADAPAPEKAKVEKVKAAPKKVPKKGW
jgi:hypothetical protein